MGTPHFWGPVCRASPPMPIREPLPADSSPPPVGDALCATRPLCSHFHVYFCLFFPPVFCRFPSSSPEKGKPDKRGLLLAFCWRRRLGMCVCGGRRDPPLCFPQNLGPACCGLHLAGSSQTCHQFFPKGSRVPAPRLGALPFCLRGLFFFFF